MQTVTDLTLRSKLADAVYVNVSSLSKNLQFLGILGNQIIITGRDSWIEAVHRTGLGLTKSVNPSL